MRASDGGEILSQLVGIIRRYLLLTAAEADAVALWIVHTHAFDAAGATPYLAITSAEKRCGKTNLLELLEMLVAKPWLTGSVSAAVLFRKTAAERPTLLLDESDATFNGNREYGEALRGILNSGYRKGGKISRCVQEGKNFVPRDYETFCPKAFAGIGKLPETVADRSIPIRLTRKLPGEQVARFRRREVESEATPIREQITTWAAGAVESLALMKPALPESLGDRQQDCTEPLLAIADEAGGEWPDRARAALVTILTGTAAEDQSERVRLLADIRGVFIATGRDKLSSSELLGKLAHDETLTWGEFANGRPLTLIGLARLLKPFGIQPRTIREGQGTIKGYLKESFADAWARFLPAPTLPVVKPSQPAKTLADLHSLKPSQAPHVTILENEMKPIDMQAVTDVTGAKPDVRVSASNSSC
jgi:hypothetical protein